LGNRKGEIMPKLNFYDVKIRKSFMSDKYNFISKINPRTKKIVYLAVATSPSKNKAYRIVSKEFYMKYKK
jgi:hypothetical protein